MMNEHTKNSLNSKTCGMFDHRYYTNSNHAINPVFDNKDLLAKQLEEDRIEDDIIKLSEDAAAVGSVWSFGLSMAVVAALAAADHILQNKIQRYNEALTNCDTEGYSEIQ